MTANRKASIAKRARELAQKDRVKDREQRRAERKVRAEARAASGIVGPEIEELQPLIEGGEGGEGGEGDASDVNEEGGIVVALPVPAASASRVP